MHVTAKSAQLCTSRRVGAGGEAHHTQMSHVTHKRVASHVSTNECQVALRLQLSHGTPTWVMAHPNESRHKQKREITNKCVVLHISRPLMCNNKWVTAHTNEWVMAHTNMWVMAHTNKWVMLHISRPLMCNNEWVTAHTNKWVMAHTNKWVMAHTNEWVMLHISRPHLLLCWGSRCVMSHLNESWRRQMSHGAHMGWSHVALRRNMRHTTPKGVTVYTNESRHTQVIHATNQWGRL